MPGGARGELRLRERELAGVRGGAWSFEFVGHHPGDDGVEITSELRANGRSVQRAADGYGRNLTRGK